jgi:hypothetical protein
MSLPYSADLRERVLLAHEHGEGNAAAPSKASGGGAVSGGGQYGEELGAGRRDGGAAGRQTAGPRSGAASGRARCCGTCAHRRPQARALLEGAKFALLPVPRSSPDVSPIKLCWSKLKTPLRTAEPRSIDAPEEQISPALDTITTRMPKAGFACRSSFQRASARKVKNMRSSGFRACSVPPWFPSRLIATVPHPISLLQPS